MSSRLEREYWEVKLLAEGWTRPEKKEKKVVSFQPCPLCHLPIKTIEMTPSGVCERCEILGDSPGDVM
jgi:hypothetical protein